MTVAGFRCPAPSFARDYGDNVPFITCMGCGAGKDIPVGKSLRLNDHKSVCPVRAGFRWLCDCQSHYCDEYCNGDWYLPDGTSWGSLSDEKKGRK